MHPFLAVAMAAGSRPNIGVVTLTTQIDPNHASAVTEGQGGTATWIFRADGTVDRQGEDHVPEVQQVNASTDWVIPNSKASSLYELKWDQVSGDAPTNGGVPAEGVWTSLGSGIAIGAWALFGQFEEGVVTVSIRYNGGPTLDSANFEWQAVDTDA